MGASCCKQLCPNKRHWKNEENVVCAYVYYEDCCCLLSPFRRAEARRFRLRGVNENNDNDNNNATSEWTLASNEDARRLVESEVYDPNGLPVSVARDAPKTTLCGHRQYKVAVERLNQEWVPNMNSRLDPYGFEVDGFEWVDYVYVSHGQYGGAHMQPIPRFCIRVKKLVGTTTGTVRSVDDDDNNNNNDKNASGSSLKGK